MKKREKKKRGKKKRKKTKEKKHRTEKRRRMKEERRGSTTTGSQVLLSPVAFDRTSEHCVRWSRAGRRKARTAVLPHLHGEGLESSASPGLGQLETLCGASAVFNVWFKVYAVGKVLKCETMCVCNSSIDCSCLSLVSGVRTSVVYTLPPIKHLPCLYAFTMCCRAVLSACSPQNALLHNGH